MRNVNKENEQILNGNRFMVNTFEHTGVFQRDVDKLVHQYRNLRSSVFNQYKDYLRDQASQEELRSYIDEQFIRLVKEYDINGEVDFPGYIKKKLNYRVKHSYIKGEYRDRKRVFTTKGEFDISKLIDKEPMMDEELDFYETLEYALRSIEFTPLERMVFYFVMREMDETEIFQEVQKEFPAENHSEQEINTALKRVQYILKSRLKRSLEL